MRFFSPPPASEASGGEGSGWGAPQARSKRSPPTPSVAASLRRPTPPANGRDGDSGERISTMSYFVFENSAFSFGPVSALWRMMPSQPASYALAT